MGSAEQKNVMPDDENPNRDKSLKIGAPVRIPRLDKLSAVRREAGTLYSEARRREGRFPDAQTAQRLSNILREVRESIGLEDLAAQIREEVLQQVRAELAQERRT
jgi:hypothetical protein